MFCEKCGYKIEDNAAFCENCGEPLNIKTEEEASEIKTSKNITKNQTGSYHWMYEFSFWKNPAVLITAYKVLLIALMVPALLMFFLTLGDGIAEAFKILINIIGYGIVLMTVLLIVAYILLGFMYGGKYYVLFKMDDKGINHIQLERQYKRAQALGVLTALIGVSAGSLSAGGAGLLGASKQSLYTNFNKVKSIKIYPRRNTIYINESLKRNQIYAAKEDLQFVKEYIVKNCPKNTRIIEK
ncbi:MAG: zinc-ribbon domain-containing protein [Sedimentibacter sp.]